MPGKRVSNRVFGLVFATAFGIVTAVGWFVFENWIAWAAATSLTLLIVAILVPGLLLPLNLAWGRVAHRVGQLNNLLLLGVFFWIFVVPASLILRLFRWDPMRRRYDASAESYLEPVDMRVNTPASTDMF